MPRIVDASPDPGQMYQMFQAMAKPTPRFNWGNAITGGIGAYEKIETLQREQALDQLRAEALQQKLEEDEAAQRMKEEIAGILAKYGGSGGVAKALPEIQQAFVQAGDLDSALKIAKNAQQLELGRMRLEKARTGGTGKKGAGGFEEYEQGLGEPAAPAAEEGPGWWDRFTNWASGIKGADLIPTRQGAENVFLNTVIGGMTDVSNAAGTGAQLLGTAMQRNLPDWMPGRETIGGGLENWGKEQRKLGGYVEAALPQMESEPGRLVAGAGRMLAPLVAGPFAPAVWGAEVGAEGAGRMLDKGESTGEAALAGTAEGLLMTALANPAIKAWARAGGGGIKGLVNSILGGAKMGGGMAAASPAIEGALTGEGLPEGYGAGILRGTGEGAIMGAMAHGVNRGLNLIKGSPEAQQRAAIEEAAQREIAGGEAPVSAAEAVLGTPDTAAALEKLAIETSGKLDKALAEKSELPLPVAKKKEVEQIAAEVPEKTPASDVTLSEGNALPDPTKQIESKGKPVPLQAPEPTAQELRAIIQEEGGLKPSGSGPTLWPSQVQSKAETTLPESAIVADMAPSESRQMLTSSPSQSQEPSSSSKALRSSADILADPIFITHYNDTTAQLPFLGELARYAAGEGGKFNVLTKKIEAAAGKVIRKRTSNKPNYQYQDLGDLVRGTVMLPKSGNYDDIAGVLSRLNEKTKIVPGSIEDNFKKPSPWGYIGMGLNVELPGGKVGELQLHTPESVYIRHHIHPFYQAHRADVKIHENVLAESRRIAARAQTEYWEHEVELMPRIYEHYDRIAAGEVEPPFPVVGRGAGVELERAAVSRIPTDQVAVRADLMQFKRSDEKTTGTNAQDTIKAEKWNDVAAGNILLWEPKNPKEYDLAPGQKYIVANGHHRLEFAKRIGRKALNSQILREADGFSVEEARQTAAEANILEGKGTIYDQAKFLREQSRAHGQDEALGRARQIGITGRKAATIAFNAETNLYDAFTNERVTPDQAEKIAKAAPNNDAVQRLGLKLVQQSPDINPQELTMVLSRAAEKSGPVVEGEQGALFGADDSALLHQQKLASVASSWRRELTDQIGAIRGAANRPELAAKGGVNVADQQATLAKLNDLQQTAAKVEKFWKYPDILAEVEARAAGTGTQTSLADRWKSEAGATTFFTSDIAEAAEAVAGGARAIADSVMREGLPSSAEVAAMEGSGKGTVKAVSESAKDLGGNIKLNPFSQTGYNYRVLPPRARKVLGEFRKAMRFMETMATKHPKFRPAKTAAENAFKYEHQVIYDGMGDLMKYVALPDKTRVNLVFETLQKIQETGRKFPHSVEAYMRLGLDRAEADAMMGWYTFSKKAPALIQEGLLADPPDWAKRSPQHFATFKARVEAFTREMQDMDYFPLSRWGDYYVRSKDAGGGEGWFSLHEKAGEAKKEFARLKKEGATVEIGKMERPEGVVYEHMAPDLYHKLNDLTTEYGGNYLARPRQGFAGHLAARKFVPGWSKNIERSMKSYLVGLARWRAQKLAGAEFDTAIKKMEGEPALQAEAAKLKKRVQEGTGEWGGARRFASLWYLTRPVSAFLNATQSVTSTLPELANYEGVLKGSGRWLKAAGLQLNRRLKNERAFAKEHPELEDAIRTAERDGVFESVNVSEMGGKYTESFGKGWTDYALWLFHSAEQMNRKHAFIAGYDMAKAKGLSQAEAVEFGKKLASDTQYDYTVANRPAITTGWKSLPATFQLYSANYIRSLRNKVGGPVETPWGTKTNPMRALALQLGVMGTLGGATAVAGLSQLIKAAEAAGYDPKGEARKFLHKYMDDKDINVLFYGPMSLLGYNITSNIALSELAPGAEQGLLPAVGRLALGIAADIPQRMARAKMLYEKGRHLEAVKQIMPPILRNLTDVAQWATPDAQGKRWMRAPATGEPLVANPTTGEMVGRALGVTPARLNLKYEERHSSDVLKQEAIDNHNINEKLAWAKYNKDAKEAGRLLAWVKEHNAKATRPSQRIDVNWPAVKTKLKSLSTPGYGTWRYMPKKAREPELKDLQKRFREMTR